MASRLFVHSFDFTFMRYLGNWKHDVSNERLKSDINALSQIGINNVA